MIDPIAVQWFLVVSSNYLGLSTMAKSTKTGHGGGKEAKKTGANRKMEKRYEMRALDYAKSMASMKDSAGFIKPGSRKKVGG